MTMDKIIEARVCFNTSCDNEYDYTLIRIPNHDKEVQTETRFCKHCLIEYIGGNNLNFNTKYKLTRRVI